MLKSPKHSIRPDGAESEATGRDAGRARSKGRVVGSAIERFRRCEHVTYDPKGLHEFVMESREHGTQHRLTRNMFDAWLRRTGGSPADVALKTRLKGLLGDVG